MLSHGVAAAPRAVPVGHYNVDVVLLHGAAAHCLASLHLMSANLSYQDIRESDPSYLHVKA